MARKRVVEEPTLKSWEEGFMALVKLSTKAVGSTVKIKVNGTLRNFIVVHQGRPSSLYDASCDGTWLLMEDIYEGRAWISMVVGGRC